MFVHDLPAPGVPAQDRRSPAAAPDRLACRHAFPVKIIDAACGAVADGKLRVSGNHQTGPEAR